jgi:hypothetical protein
LLEHLLWLVQVVNDLCVNEGWRVAGLAIPGHRFDDIAIIRS